MKRYVCAMSLFILAGVALGCGGGKEALYTRGPMHFEGNFDGVYTSDFGRLELTVESGDKVVGLYEKNEKYGRLEGEIKDNLLFFNWTQWDVEMKGKPRETSGRGVFQYVVDEQQTSIGVKYIHSLKGFWAYGREKPANPWNAYKLGPKAKKELVAFDPNAGIGKVQDEEYDDASGFEDVSGGGGQEGAREESGGGSEPSEPAPAPREEPDDGNDVELF